MGDDDVHAIGDHVDDVLCGVLHQLELLLRAVAESVAAEGDDYGRTVTFCVGHDCLLFRNKKTNPLKWDENRHRLARDFDAIRCAATGAAQR